MTLTSFDGRARRNYSGLWGFLAGLVVGGGLGVAAPRLWRMMNPPQSKKAQLPKPAPSPLQTLTIAGDPKNKGLVLRAAGALQLTADSSSKLSKQQGSAIFTGFRNWQGTVNYLHSGQGSLYVQEGTGNTIDTPWQPPDYRAMLTGKQPLRVSIRSKRPMTLFFRRAGSTPVNLGTFEAAFPPPAPIRIKPTATGTTAPKALPKNQTKPAKTK